MQSAADRRPCTSHSYTTSTHPINVESYPRCSLMMQRCISSRCIIGSRVSMRRWSRDADPLEAGGNWNRRSIWRSHDGTRWPSSSTANGRMTVLVSPRSPWVVTCQMERTPLLTADPRFAHADPQPCRHARPLSPGSWQSHSACHPAARRCGPQNSIGDKQGAIIPCPCLSMGSTGIRSPKPA